jgi:serine/threonine-protein kinase
LRSCPQCRSIYTAHVDFCGIDGSRLVQTESDPLVGYEVDRYLVLERIGMGAMGCVYRVRHSVLEQEHAMKILYGDLGQDARIVERFKREAKAISMMRHPNILSVTDFGRTANGLTFLVMEYVKGATLLELIERSQGLLPLSLVARIVGQVASGLGEAHRSGFVHRDVKPANIIVGVDGVNEYVKILDFGIVGLRSEAFDTRLTGTGFIIGTPAYMSPEQARDPSYLTPAADFYSLGVILYEMLTGKVPFDAEQPVDVLIRHSTDPVPPMPPAGGLEDLARWMLEKRPENRPQSAEEILEGLSKLHLEDIESKPGFTPGDTVEEASVEEILVDVKDEVISALEEPEPIDLIEEVELPMLDPITYQGTEKMVVHYEWLCDRLARINQTLSGAQRMESGVRQTFEIRLAEMMAAVRPGLREYRYVDLASKISELERDISTRVRASSPG